MVLYSRYRRMTWLDILNKIEDEKDKWYYVTALRGCDISCVAIKKLFTGFIRGARKEYFAGFHIGYIDIRNFESYILNEHEYEIAYKLIEEAKELRNSFVLYHYMQHIIDALDVINRYLEEYVSRRLMDIAVILYKQEWDRVKEIAKLLNDIREYVLKELEIRKG